MWQILFLKLPAPLRNLGAVAMPDGILIVGGHDGLQP
jgi:response regulator RpfG family c-di-GMP phosphodiesterase